MRSQAVRSALSSVLSPKDALSAAASGAVIKVNCQFPTAARAYYERAKKTRQTLGAPVKISLSDHHVTFSLRIPTSNQILSVEISEIPP